MPESDVRNIESLEAFRDGLVRLASEWQATVEEVRMLVQRAEEYFATDRPAYWRRQYQLAERDLNEARDNLAQKKAAIRPGDRPPATEAAKRVQVTEQRLRECQKKQKECSAWSREISRQCDALLGPMADVMQHCEVILPTAARELQSLIDQLHLYAEQNRKSPD